MMNNRAVSKPLRVKNSVTRLWSNYTRINNIKTKIVDTKIKKVTSETKNAHNLETDKTKSSSTKRAKLINNSCKTCWT